MKILHEKTEDSEYVFFIESDTGRIAEMQCRLDETGCLTIVHTKVNEEHTGKGIGKQLVNHAINYALEHNLQIVPQCSFTRAMFDKMRDNDDFK